MSGENIYQAPKSDVSPDVVAGGVLALQKPFGKLPKIVTRLITVYIILTAISIPVVIALFFVFRFIGL